MNRSDLDGLNDDQIYAKVASSSGFPEQALRNLVQTESGGQAGLVSKAGAMGYTQIMPKTLATLNKRYDADFDPNNFADAMFMTGELLKENLQHFGNIPDAVSAYNGGWDKSKWGNKETAAYTPKVLAGTGILDAFNTRGEELREDRLDAKERAVGANDVEKRTPAEKLAITQEYAQGLFANVSPVADMQAFNDTLQQDTPAPIAMGGTTLTPDYQNADAQLQAVQAAQEAQIDKVDARTYGETMWAAMEQTSIANNIYSTIASDIARREDEVQAVDKAWQAEFITKRGELTKGMSAGAIVEAEYARNLQEFNLIKERDTEDLKNQQILSESSHPLLWGIAGSLTDPISLAATGATAGYYNVGRTAALSSKLLSGAQVGVATSLEVTAGLDFAGKETTAEDYIHAAAAGLVLGTAFSGVGHALTPRMKQEMADTATGMHDRAAQMYTDNLKAAMKANPEATAQEAAAAAKQMGIDQSMQYADDLVKAADVPVFGKNRVLATETLTPDEQLGTATLSSEDVRMSVTGIRRDANEFLADHPDIMPNLDAIADKLNTRQHFGMQSAGSILRTDKDPLARTIGVLIAEDAAGESGYRAGTASIKSVVMNNYFNNGIEHGYFTNYTAWMAEQGIKRATGVVDTFITGKPLAKFNNEVATELRRRGRPDYTPSTRQSVIRAANLLENGWQKMGDTQRAAKVLGHEFIPESSIGYMPQQVDGKVVQALSAKERQNVIDELKRQLLAKEWDEEIADRVSRNYLKRAQDYAMGSQGLHAPAPKELREMLIDDLYTRHGAGEIDDAALAAGLEAARKGASKHTGKRIQWDLDASIMRDNGSVMPLSGMFVNDPVTLYRGYANRAAGDVSMAHFGIKGDRDIALIEEALRTSTTGNPIETVGAWRQLVAEIYMRPVSFDSATKTGGVMRAIRQFTSLRLNGGTLFPQVNETMNAIAALGVQHTMAFAKNVPKLGGELKLLSQGIIPENPILQSIDIVAGSPLGAENYAMILPRVVDDHVNFVDGTNINTVNRLLSGGQLVHQKFSYMRTALTIQQRGFAVEIASKALRFIKEGTEDVALKDMGFTPRLREALLNDMDRIAKFGDDGKLVALDIRQMQDKGLMNEFVSTIYRGTGQIIQQNYPGETGKWMRSEVVRTLMQLRKFPAGAIEKQMLRQFRNYGTARTLGGMMASLSMGTLIYYGRTQAAALLLDGNDRKEFLEKRLSAQNVMSGALMYVSTLGMSTDILGLGAGIARTVDNEMDLGFYNSRGVPASGIGSLVPALGTLDNIYNFSQNPTARNAIQIMPFTNLPMTTPAVNFLKSAADDDD